MTSKAFPELSFPLTLTGRTAFVRFPRRCCMVSCYPWLVCRVLLRKGMARTGRSKHEGNHAVGTDGFAYETGMLGRSFDCIGGAYGRWVLWRAFRAPRDDIARELSAETFALILWSNKKGWCAPSDEISPFYIRFRCRFRLYGRWFRGESAAEPGSGDPSSTIWRLADSGCSAGEHGSWCGGSYERGRAQGVSILRSCESDLHAR